MTLKNKQMFRYFENDSFALNQFSKNLNSTMLFQPASELLNPKKVSEGINHR
jgi:hypothetical protein